MFEGSTTVYCTGENDSDEADSPTVKRSPGAQDQVDATLRLDKAAHLTWFERKGRILERFLHLAAREPAEIAALGVRATIGVFLCEFGEFRRVARDFGLVLLEERDGLLFGSGYVRLCGIAWVGGRFHTRGNRE